MVPADVRVLSAKDLFLNQAASAPTDIQNPLDLPNVCFLGSNVESGSATAVVILTGSRTYFGSLAANIVGHPNRRVVAGTGDGGFLMKSQELADKA